MKKLPLILTLLIISLTTVACSSSSLVAGSQPAQSGAVLLFDDFSDPTSGWDTWNENGSLVAYENGILRILVNEPQFDYWTRPGRRFENVRIAVEATRAAGPEDNDFGVICRYKDQNNFYAFLISSDGYAGIMKVKEGVYQTISGEEMQRVESVNGGEKTNFLGADCVGPKLIFYINGQKTMEAQDSDFTAGEVGLIAGTYSSPGADIHFDNFVASKP